MDDGIRDAGSAGRSPDAEPRSPRRRAARCERLTAAVPDLDVEFMDADAVAAAEPSLVPGFAACRLETGYPIPPASATAAFGRLAARRGAEIRVGVAAEPWIEDGTVLGVELADGSQQAAGIVLVAAGPWSPPLVDPTGGLGADHAAPGA